MLQLAKSAICAGLVTLISAETVAMKEILWYNEMNNFTGGTNMRKNFGAKTWLYPAF
ncbi:MAG: hypothetical protein IJX62_04215 [Clostridia bacterium]|nr:hypothetical protein [Clostridia bacterium]